MERKRDALQIYLNDRRAALSAGVARARRCQRNNEGTFLGDEIRSIAADIRADEESLIRVARHLDVPDNRLMEFGARGAEWFSRLQTNGTSRGYSPLDRLLDLEMLLSAVDAKSSLWRALIAADIPVPSGIDLRELDDRASDQRARLRLHHSQAAEATLHKADAL